MRKMLKILAVAGLPLLAMGAGFGMATAADNLDARRNTAWEEINAAHQSDNPGVVDCAGTYGISLHENDTAIDTGLYPDEAWKARETILSGFRNCVANAEVKR